MRFDSAYVATPTVNAGVNASMSDVDNIWASGGTVMAWIRLDSYGAGGFGRLIGKENDGGTAGWGIFVEGVNARIEFLHGFSSVNGGWGSPTDSIELNTWYHVAIVWSKTGTPAIYIDGSSVAITTVSTPSGTADNDAAHRMYIGNRGNGDRSFDGLMADLRVYDAAMTAGEIQTIFSSRGADDIVRSLTRRWSMSPHVPGLAANTPYTGQTQVTNPSVNVLSVFVPTEAVDGDLLIMVGFAGGTSTTAPTFTTPAGWTARTYLALPSAATRPAIRVFTRIASSEPANYALFASVSSPMIAFMYSIPGVADSVDVSTTAIGTSSTPSTPTATPTENCLIMRVMAHDNDVQAPNRWWDAFPGDLKALSSNIESGGGSNGGGLYIGIESWDDTATGAKSWTIDASDEWGGITIGFPYGDGIEGLPLKDVSDAQVHAVSYGHVVMAVDELTVGGF